jgi:hypothetical protein
LLGIYQHLGRRVSRKLHLQRWADPTLPLT